MNNQTRRFLNLLPIITCLALVLAGCGGAGEEPTAVPPTTTALETVPPPPTSAVPTATLTDIPPTAIATTSPPADTDPPISLPEETITVADLTITLPEGAVIYFRQDGGFAGVMYSWLIYPDGTIVNSADQTSQVEASAVAAALETIKISGFYNLTQPEPSNICCDFFHYTLIVRDGVNSNVISLSEGEPNLPAAFNESVGAVLPLVESSFPSS